MQGSARSLAWVLAFVAACGARGSNPTTPGDDVPATPDAPATRDAPAGMDAAATPDAPPGTDAGVGPDRPAAMDAPVAADVPTSAPSQQIAAVRATPIGPTALRVDGVVVTYVVPATLRGDGTVSPSDPAGFFVQAERAGPALFVAVDPATLTPPPAPGDRVSFTVGRVTSPTPATHWAAEISGYARAATGASLGALLQDVSGAADLVTSLLSYEHELITLTGTVISDFGAGGVGFLQAPIATAALPGDALLRLRVPIDVRTAVGLRNGCRFTITATPLWRYDVTAQASIWSPRDVTGVTCPPPMVDSGVVDVPRDAGAPDTGTPVTGDDRVWVVRIGDGSAALSNAAVPVFLEAYQGSTGASAGATLALPTAASGSHRALTLSGSSSTEGVLSRSANGSWVSLAGYDLPPGTLMVNSTQAPRVIARVNAAGAVDTRTSLGATADRAAIRAAVSVDGSGFWSVHTNGSAGDVVYTGYGGSPAATAVTNREVFRTLVLFGQQLLATGANPSGTGVFATTSLPRAPGGTIALLPGFPLVSGGSPYGIAAFDRDGNGAADVLFVGDDQALTSTGGVQCWRLSGGAWSQAGSVTGLTNPMRGLIGRASGSNYVLYGITSESRARLQRIDVDGATLAGTVLTLAQAEPNTTYRGLAFAPR